MQEFRHFIQQHFDKDWHAIIPVLNVILIAISIWLNITYNGGFCVFVPWAMVVQIICFVNMVTFTWMEKTSLWWFNAFICGISTGVFFYWVIFSGILVILFPVSILFIFLLVWRNVKHPVRKQSRPWYFAGITVCVVFAIVSAILFSTAAKKIKQGEYDTKNPMTERILGMHFRYHTRICIFDGWRPPLHDPAMVIGMRLTGDNDPLEGMTLESRLLLYHEVYPSLPVKNHCACSLESAENGYFEDYLWKALDFKPMKVMKRVPVYRCGEYAESNNERLKDAGLPFSFISTEFNQIVVNLKDGSDTITSGSAGSYFDEISLVEFDGQPMYRLTCELIRDPIKNKVMHWEVFILPNGIQFATDSFNTHGEYTYWLASNSIDIMDSVEIFYPMIDVRDTVKIYRIESQ
ncbi:MAG: hypothetical protein IJP65_02110 [Bacteroidales bacterium]|nr:hypothetical protein [Bacteroidales bacterium]